MSGPNPISPALINSWVELTGTRLDLEDIKIIFAADAAFLEAESEEAAYRAAVAQDEAKANAATTVTRAPRRRRG